MKRLQLNLGNWRAALELGRIPPPVVSERNEFETGFATWAEAAGRASGYDAAAILERAVRAAALVRDGGAAFERDTVTFAQREVYHPLVTWLLYAARTHGALRLMDFGGALGSLYYQHRFLLDDLPGLRWGVVEQAHVVQAGRAGFETAALGFFDTIADCVAAIQPNFVLLSSVLQYLEEPYALLDQILAQRFPYVLVDRTMARRGMAEEIAVQHVPPSIYPASYPLWLLDAERLEACFAHHGYRVLDRFDPFPGSTFGPAASPTPYQGWFLTYEADAA